MSDAQRRTAAEAFWQDEGSAMEQAEAVSLIARRMNFRPRSVATLPLDRRARMLASMAQVSEPIAARLLVAYHLAAQRPMMSAFLDALGIPHEDGLISEDTTAAVEEGKLAAAVGRVRGAFPDEDVRLYLFTLLLQDPDTWAGLREFAEQG